jgi:uncharacterized protein YprB with RNaseH-like and TPR domain
MKTVLLSGLTEDQQDEMRQTFAHSVVLRQQLIKILTKKAKDARSASTSKDAYNIPNWAYLQADTVGYERALAEVCSLLSHADDGDVSAPIGKETLPSVKKVGRPRKVAITVKE